MEVKEQDFLLRIDKETEFSYSKHNFLRAKYTFCRVECDFISICVRDARVCVQRTVYQKKKDDFP